MSALLNTLDNDQLDFVSLGLEHNFGVALTGNARENDFMLLVVETGKLIAVSSSTLTVKDLCDISKAIGF